MDPFRAVLKFVTVLATTIVCLSPVACSINRDNQITEMVKAGADPIDARCSLMFATDSALCTVRAASKSRQ